MIRKPPRPLVSCECPLRTHTGQLPETQPPGEDFQLEGTNVLVKSIINLMYTFYTINTILSIDFYTLITILSTVPDNVLSIFARRYDKLDTIENGSIPVKLLNSW